MAEGRTGAGRLKKKLACGAGDPAAVARGRAVYNGRCYFCHGYDGNAATVAAGMLDPKPRDFTRAPDLDRQRIFSVVRSGKAGTAMKSFGGLLSEAEMRDVAAFVAETFVACGARNTAYHTAANGWPDHAARYGPAFDFAAGVLPIDIPERLLEPQERRGLALFRSACISCHEGRTARQSALALESPGVGGGTDLWSGKIAHEGEYEVPTIHDVPPDLPDPTPEEALGQRLYGTACAECHAADGTGMNWIGKFLDPGPPDFTAQDFAYRFAFDRFAAQTLDFPAGNTMPSFRSVLSEAEVHAIAAYVRRAFVEPSHGG